MITGPHIAIALIVAGGLTLLTLAVRALWPRHGQHEAPRRGRPAGEDPREDWHPASERMASTDTRERYDWPADDMPWRAAGPDPLGPLPYQGPPLTGAEIRQVRAELAKALSPGRPAVLPPSGPPAPLRLPPTPKASPSGTTWTGPHAVPDIPGTYTEGCAICGKPDHAAEGHDAIVSIWHPPAFREAPPPDGLPQWVRDELHHDTTEQTMDAPSMIMPAIRGPGGGTGGDGETGGNQDGNGTQPMKTVITRMHLALHQDATSAACKRTPPAQALTMNPDLVTCGNCQRTTLYATAARVTGQITALRQAGR